MPPVSIADSTEIPPPLDPGKAADEVDLLRAAKGSPFDLTWFIPAVVKYRRLFGEVLLASFFL